MNLCFVRGFMDTEDKSCSVRPKRGHFPLNTREFNSDCHKRKVVSRYGESRRWIFLLWGADIKRCWVSLRGPEGWGGFLKRQMWHFIPGWVQISDTSALLADGKAELTPGWLASIKGEYLPVVVIHAEHVEHLVLTPPVSWKLKHLNTDLEIRPLLHSFCRESCSLTVEDPSCQEQDQAVRQKVQQLKQTNRQKHELTEKQGRNRKSDLTRMT